MNIQTRTWIKAAKVRTPAKARLEVCLIEERLAPGEALWGAAFGALLAARRSSPSAGADFLGFSVRVAPVSESAHPTSVLAEWKVAGFADTSSEARDAWGGAAVPTIAHAQLAQSSAVEPFDGVYADNFLSEDARRRLRAADAARSLSITHSPSALPAGPVESIPLVIGARTPTINSTTATTGVAAYPPPDGATLTHLLNGEPLGLRDQRRIRDGSGIQGNDDPGVSSRETFGLNPNDLTDPNRVIAVANQFQLLGARWVRLELIRSQPPSHWSWVVDRFRERGVNVLALASNRTWTGPSRDPSSCAGGERRYPTAFGFQLVNQFIPEVTPYVQALGGRVTAWEIWNEGNVSGTGLCPENYAFLLVEARLRWSNIGTLGVSLMSFGSTPGARDYLDDLFNRTDKLIWYRENFGGNPPWHKVMLHPYPGGEMPGDFLPAQFIMMWSVQPTGLWYTEIGWHGHASEEEQADMLAVAYIYAAYGFAEKMFWFSLYDCAEPFGLIADCGNPNGRERLSYYMYWWLANNL